MVHIFGGPHKLVRCIQNGDCIFIEWPLNGLIRIVLTTGALWDSRKAPWHMHPDDLQRITVGNEPYHVGQSQESTLRANNRSNSSANLLDDYSAMCKASTLNGAPHIQQSRKRTNNRK